MRHPQQHKTLQYVRHLVRHPLHVMFVVFLPAMALVTWSVVVAILGVAAELTVLCVAHRLPPFRRWVDLRIHEADVRRAAASRAELLARLTSVHRAELHRLEAITDAVRDRVSPPGELVCGQPEDCLGMSRMLAAYVGGALAYASASSRLMMTDRPALAVEIASLEEAARSGRTEALRAVATERLRIARMRAARWDRSRDELDVMQEQLGLISDIIRLTHENATAPRQVSALSDSLERAMASIPDAERTIHELVELLEIEAAPDPRVLEIGRQLPPTPPRPAPALTGTGPARTAAPA